MAWSYNRLLKLQSKILSISSSRAVNIMMAMIGKQTASGGTLQTRPSQAALHPNTREGSSFSANSSAVKPSPVEATTIPPSPGKGGEGKLTGFIIHQQESGQILSYLTNGSSSHPLCHPNNTALQWTQFPQLHLLAGQQLWECRCCHWLVVKNSAYTAFTRAKSISQETVVFTTCSG